MLSYKPDLENTTLFRIQQELAQISHQRAPYGQLMGFWYLSIWARDFFFFFFFFFWGGGGQAAKARTSLYRLEIRLKYDTGERCL